MKLIQDFPGHNWHTDDPACLYLNRTGHLTDAPKTLRCFAMDDSLNKGEFVEIELDSLEYLATAMFGEGRLSPGGGNTRWTGNSYKHAIYRCTPRFRRAIVIIETHGGGSQGYYIATLTAKETWTHLASSVPSEMLWNICHDLCRMYANARYVERNKTHTEFVEGRLKKRRRGQTVYVEVLPRQNGDGSGADQKPLTSPWGKSND